MSQTEVQLIKDSAVVTADIADQAVTLDKLPHGTGSNDGKFLRANNGADPSFETVTSTTINNNADNRVITGSGTANTLEGESGLTFSSNTLSINTNGSSIAENNVRFQSAGKAYIDHATTGQDIDIRTSVSSSLDTTGITIKSNGNLAFAAGKGIDFSAASGSASGSTSAVLDDYEEGTYSPFITQGMDPDISSNTGAYTYLKGYYRKIGTLVEFNFYIQITNNSSYEGDGAAVKIAVPFTQDYANQKRGWGLLTYQTMQGINVSSNGIHFQVYNSAADLLSGATAVTMGNGTAQHNRYIIGGGFYHST